MANRDYTTGGPLPLTLIDLEQHPDGELLRLIAQGTKAREAYYLLTKRGYRRGLAKADRAEVSAAYCARFRLETTIVATPAKTKFGLTAKALFALEHEATANVHGANLTWGIGGLLFAVVNDAMQMGAFA
jgi:hypothetical protein